MIFSSSRRWLEEILDSKTENNETKILMKKIKIERKLETNFMARPRSLVAEHNEEIP